MGRTRRGMMVLLWAAAVSMAGLPAGGDVIRVPRDVPTIQQGIDAADHGDTVLVADGVYSGPGNIELDPCGKGIHIRSEKGPEGCTIDCQGQGRGFYLHCCEGCFTVIEGFTIINGSATDGGGLFGFWSAPVLRDCRFIDCRASDSGGAIYGFFFSPRILDCVFSGNVAYHGGALHLCQTSAPDIVRCSISGNTAGVYGGGIRCVSGAKPAISDCLLIGNSALLGGGLSSRDASPRADRCRFELNRAWDGGGVYILSSDGLVIVDTEFTGNKADWCGGAVYSSHAAAAMVNCLFVENQALAHGGALFGHHFDAKMQLCTITGNDAAEGGGALASSRSELTVVDSLLWGNGSEPVLLLEGPAPAITCSDVEGGWVGAGNLDADPLLTVGPDGSCCLSEVAAGQTKDSPCLDAGSGLACDVSLPTAEPGVYRDLQPAGTRSDWGEDCGRLNLGYHRPVDTVEADIRCSPLVGVLPLPLEFTVSLRNRCEQQRRVATAVDLVTASGQGYANWRQGWTALPPGQGLEVRWALEVPDLPTLQGINRFDLAIEDVTPVPYNQPPCRPAGHEARDSCSVMGLAPP